MITYLKGNIFNSPAKILVNTVNTVGVMGKGVALEFKNRYPEMFSRYKQLCEDKQFDIGNLYLWKKEQKWVLLFPTKSHWRNPSKLEYIERGLEKFASTWDTLGADSIAFPRLGCGNGGLNWSEVRPLMEKYLKNIPLQIYIYIDNYDDHQPEHFQVNEIEQWLSNVNGFVGYDKFQEQVKKRLAGNNTVKLADGLSVEVELKEGKFSIDAEKASEFDVDNLRLFWNFLRDVRVVTENEIPVEFSDFANVALALMKSLRVVEPIIVSKNGLDFSGKANGYQFIQS